MTTGTQQVNESIDIVNQGTWYYRPNWFRHPGNYRKSTKISTATSEQAKGAQPWLKQRKNCNHIRASRLSVQNKCLFQFNQQTAAMQQMTSSAQISQT